jgi:hypothetical protein
MPSATILLIWEYRISAATINSENCPPHWGKRNENVVKYLLFNWLDIKGIVARWELPEE